MILLSSTENTENYVTWVNGLRLIFLKKNLNFGSVFVSGFHFGELLHV